MMFRLMPIAFAVLFLLAQAAVALAKSPARLALLIGNQNYAAAVGPLKNPHNDVDLIAATLKTLGFDVQVVKDASYRKMDIAIRRHVDRTRRAGEGAISFFYYSGHGVANPETKRNFLLPTDVTSARDANIWYEAFQQNEIINRLVKDASNAVHYVIFDACRDELKLSGPSVKSLGEKKGFVAINERSGILIAYATAPGRTASDRGSGGGPYARALARELVKPGIEAVTMFRNVQLRVKKAIGQDPWLSFPALPAVYFAGRESEMQRLEQFKPTGPALPRPASTTFEQQAELDYWSSVRDSKDPKVIGTYLAIYPNGRFALLARTLIAKYEAADELNKNASASPLQSDVGSKAVSTRSLVLKIQRRLKDLGCYTGKLDGVWGAGSRSALFRATGTNEITNSEAEMLGLLRSVPRTRCIRKNAHQNEVGRARKQGRKDQNQTVRKKQQCELFVQHHGTNIIRCPNGCSDAPQMFHDYPVLSCSVR